MGDLDVPAQVIPYATVDEQIRCTWLLRAARILAVAPLIIGVSIMLLWLPIRGEALMIAGLITIEGGVLATCAGGICLLVYFFLNRLSDQAMRKRVNRQFTLTLMLLLLNYPAAALCISVALAVAGPPG